MDSTFLRSGEKRGVHSIFSNQMQGMLKQNLGQNKGLKWPKKKKKKI